MGFVTTGDLACDGPDSVHQPTHRRCNAVGHRAQLRDGQALQARERSDKFAKRQFLLVGDEEGVTTLTALQGALNSFEDIVDVAGVKDIVTTVDEGELPGVDCLGQRPAEWVAGPPECWAATARGLRRLDGAGVGRLRTEGASPHCLNAGSYLHRGCRPPAALTRAGLPSCSINALGAAITGCDVP